MEADVIDQARDTTGRHVFRLLATYGAPEFVKRADREAVAGTDTSAPGLYADPANRRWFVGTAPATYVSAMSFFDQKAALDAGLAAVVEKRLEKAAAHHAIGGMIARVKAAVAAKTATDVSGFADGDFALVWDEDGTRRREYPLRNPAEVKRACEYLRARRAEFEYADRRAMAVKILEKAAAMGLDLDDDLFLYKTAGAGSAPAETVARAVFDRAEALRRRGGDPAVQEKLARVAAGLLASPAYARLPDTICKVAGFLDAVDRAHSLPAARPPEDDLFVVTEKEARAFAAEHVATKTGSVYSRADLAALPVPRLEAVLGDEFASAVTAGGAVLDLEKLAAVVPTLPRPDAALFDRLAGEAGIRPVFRQAAG